MYAKAATFGVLSFDFGFDRLLCFDVCPIFDVFPFVLVFFFMLEAAYKVVICLFVVCGAHQRPYRHISQLIHTLTTFTGGKGGLAIFDEAFTFSDRSRHLGIQ